MLRQRAGDQDFLLFAVAEMKITAVGERKRPDFFQNIVHDFAVGVGQPPEPVRVGEASQLDDLNRFEVSDMDAAGKDGADEAGAFSGGIR